MCVHCGLAQTIITRDWRVAADQTYQQYEMYAAAGGSEQKVASGDGLLGRSVVLAARWRELGLLPPQGALLDLGCGNGSFLRAFSEAFPSWVLSGSETSDRELPGLRQIPNFKNFHGADPTAIPSGLDAFSLIHVLEYLENPRAFLATILDRTKPSGHLLIEVPAWRSNPFALMIADHASHFSAATLEMVVARAGWKPLLVTEEWVPKELSLVASATTPSISLASPSPDAEQAALQQAVAWLRDAREQLLEIAARTDSFGLFGSAIAATWLYQAAPDAVRFFVDEDPQRIGRTHLGRPIVAPDQVPEGSEVFVGVSPLLSSGIASRLARPDCRYHAARPLSGVAEHNP